MAREQFLIDKDTEDILVPMKKTEEENLPPKKKWENFWFYHKWHVVIVLVIIVVVAFLIRDFFFVRVDPDYQIALMVQHELQDEDIVKLQDELEQYADDRNGNGKVEVQLNVYYLFSSEELQNMELVNANAQMGNAAKYIGDLQVGSSMIFLSEESCYITETELGLEMVRLPEGTTPAEGEVVPQEELRVPWMDCKGLASIDLPANDKGFDVTQLGLSMRTLEGSSFEGNESKTSYWNDSKAFVDRLISGEKLNDSVSSEAEG